MENCENEDKKKHNLMLFPSPFKKAFPTLILGGECHHRVSLMKDTNSETLNTLFSKSITEAATTCPYRPQG
ncbi:hypothetical protein ACTXT7_014055 [Hymenolepis weldensis]